MRKYLLMVEPIGHNGDAGRIRTCDRGIRNPVLYPAELRHRTDPVFIEISQICQSQIGDTNNQGIFRKINSDSKQ